jgi:protein-S-isoprenylcysteine O-methyltransferase Ste14
MALKDELEREGRWLFRWRSFLPIVGAPLVLLALADAGRPPRSPAIHDVWAVLCLAVSFSGLAVRAIVVGHAPAGTSGRGTKGLRAWSLNDRGLYSVVRHPLYLGNFLIGLGAILVSLDWRLAVIYVLAFWLYYERIMMTEEAFLEDQFGARFRKWADATPAFVPRFSQWQPAPYSFSLRTVLQREYTALLSMIGLQAILEQLGFWLREQRLVFDPFRIVLLSGGVAAYVVLRTLKKQTQLLHVPGR